MAYNEINIGVIVADSILSAVFMVAAFLTYYFGEKRKTRNQNLEEFGEKVTIETIENPQATTNSQEVVIEENPQAKETQNENEEPKAEDKSEKTNKEE